MDDLKPVRVVDPDEQYKGNPYFDDCLYIQRQFEDHGYFVTTDQAREMWELYSESFAAGWLIMNGLDVFNVLQPYFEEV